LITDRDVLLFFSENDFSEILPEESQDQYLILIKQFIEEKEVIGYVLDENGEKTDECDSGVSIYFKKTIPGYVEPRVYLYNLFDLIFSLPSHLSIPEDVTILINHARYTYGIECHVATCSLLRLALETSMIHIKQKKTGKIIHRAEESKLCDLITAYIPEKNLRRHINNIKCELNQICHGSKSIDKNDAKTLFLKTVNCLVTIFRKEYS
jgi:hypothetical protein